MIYTTTLLSRGSLLGSLINKVRQVAVKKPTTTPNPIEINNNFTPTTPTPTPIVPASTTNNNNNNENRPVTAASISSSSAQQAKTTLEERVGLPPRPKKPLTPYFRFMREMRPKLIASNPSISTIEIVRQLSKNWVSADANLKDRLQAEYKTDQQIYVELRSKYDAKLTDDQRAEIKQLKQDIVEAKERKQLRKRVKELGRPKKPASAFLRFIASERINTPQSAQQTYRDWHQKSTAKWSRLSDAEKGVYLQESRKELDQYKKDISTWEEKMIRLGHIDVVRHGNLIEPPEPKPRKQSLAKK